MIKNLKNMYNDSINMIIRPPKLRYNPFDLSQSLNSIGKVSNLKTFRIKNNRNQEIQTYIYIPEEFQIKNKKKSALVYLHSNGSNSIEGIFLAKLCCHFSIGLILFDFAGCGNSEGDFITFGYNESKDTEIIIDFSFKNFGFNNFALWGRSMGAVTSILLTSHKKYNISYLILDSPFYKLKDTIAYFAKNRLGMSFFLTKFAMNFISSSIKKQVGYDIINLCVKNHVKKISIPSILIGSKNDEMVPFEHSEKIFENFSNNKLVKMYISEKKHNEAREIHIISDCFNEMIKNLLEDKSISSKKVILQILNEPKIKKNKLMRYSSNINLNNQNNSSPTKKLKKNIDPRIGKVNLNKMSLNLKNSKRNKSQLHRKRNFLKRKKKKKKSFILRFYR